MKSGQVAPIGWRQFMFRHLLSTFVFLSILLAALSARATDYVLKDGRVLQRKHGVGG